jgi:hypothetical protein
LKIAGQWIKVRCSSFSRRLRGRRKDVCESKHKIEG